MTGSTGEVAVKRDGHVHAIAAPELSGPIRVDADSEHVELPPETHVSFAEPDDAETDSDVDAETDGGVVPTRSEVEMRGGIALDREPALWCSVLSGLAFMSAGYLWGSGDVLVGVILGAAAVALGYYGTGSFWSWRGAGE